MQNRKSFLKTAAVGVAGAIGLTLIPSKVLAETKIPYRNLKYFMPIGRMIEISNIPNIHHCGKLQEEVRDAVRNELLDAKGYLIAYPSYSTKRGYGYRFCLNEFAAGDSTHSNYDTWNLSYIRMNKTMLHIIDKTPDPFMDYAEYANEI